MPDGFGGGGAADGGLKGPKAASEVSEPGGVPNVLGVGAAADGVRGPVAA